MKIQVSTSLSTLEKCFYEMISKGVMVEANTLEFVNQTAILTFTPTFAYAPTTNIIFYIYDNNGYIKSKTVSIRFVDELPNFVRKFNLYHEMTFHDDFQHFSLIWHYQLGPSNLAKAYR